MEKKADKTSPVTKCKDAIICTERSPTNQTKVATTNSASSISKLNIPQGLYSGSINKNNKVGLSGQKIILETNYFRIQKIPSWAVNQYRVDFIPDIELINFRRRVLGEHREKLGGYIFDGTVLFTVNKIPDSLIESTSKNHNGDVYKVSIKHVGVLNTTEAQYLQVLNLILRRSMEGLELQLLGRNFFDAIAKIDVRDFRIELWPGYITSIRQHQTDILLCTEITHKVMRMETILDIFKHCALERDSQDKFKKIVIGMIVLTDYNNKTYRIDDIDFNSSPFSTFSTKDGDVSYIQYYKNRYSINIRDSGQPLIISRPSEKQIRAGKTDLIMLIPELSRATGLDESMRNNFRLMKALSDHTRLTPNVRMDRLKLFNTRLTSKENSVEVLKSWDLQLDQNLVKVEGRILNRERIVFGNGIKIQTQEHVDWTKELKGKSVFKSKSLKRWKCVTTKRNYRESFDFVNALKDVAKKMGMTFNDPDFIVINYDKPESFLNAIENACNLDIQLIMTVLPNNNSERYGCIKKKCYVDRSIPSQVVVHRTICPREGKSVCLVSIATKVAIQMSAKLSGAPWMIEMPLKGLMTVGFDVCHSSYESSQSVGALVASMDLTLSSMYFSAVTQHLKGQELSNEISINMVKAVKCYTDIHFCLPKYILFYRDGVGDGQLDQVMEIEVINLLTKLKSIYERYDKSEGLKIAFVIVSKRIHTRLFLNRKNPPPGTVVDDVITLQNRFDFYLVSQSVRQGTVSPTSYNVIFDNLGLNADKLQILSYKLCHLYYNWSGTTRVPAICQYAHKLAFLIAQSIHQNPSKELERILYFL